ncbi:MAG TPA: hypothetical protein VMJ10_11390 [Kofleriaceae bacterium]|nr:hypothetical protein [Kofleriaceae bacterium]
MKRVVLLVAVTGCSFLAIRPPDPTPPVHQPVCTLLVPAVDAAWSVPYVLLGTVLLAGAPDASHGDPAWGVPLLGVSAAFLASAIYGVHEWHECRRFNREQAALATEHARDDELRRDAELARDSAAERRRLDRDQAWQLTQHAESAARAGDCATVTALDPQVRALDGELHAVVFARDAGIVRCLQGVH